MDPALLAAVGCLAMLVAMFLRLPVSFAMIGTGFLGCAVLIGPNPALQLLAADIYRQFSSYTLAVVPLFILMGQIIFRSGMSARLFTAAYAWVGHLPGGVAATTILSSMAFSTVSGSNAAATATMGAVALPELKKYRYSPSLAGGAAAIGGTLGVLIPPSTALIIIAVQSQQSISTLFRAALFPGVLVGLLLVATAFVWCWRSPASGPPGPRAGWRERLGSLGGVVEVLLLFLLAVGGLLGGLFTPTEAAAVGALGAVLIALIRGRLSRETFRLACLDTMRVSAMVVLLVASAVVFGRFLGLTRVPFELAAWVAGLPIPRLVVLLVLIGIYLLGGAMMDALGFLVISIPIFFPVLIALGYDAVWFTIIITLVTTLGAVTPPVGVNVFITSGLDRSWLSVVTVFRGAMPFYIPYVVSIAAFIAVPSLILFAV